MEGRDIVRRPWRGKLVARVRRIQTDWFDPMPPMPPQYIHQTTHMMMAMIVIIIQNVLFAAPQKRVLSRDKLILVYG